MMNTLISPTQEPILAKKLSSHQEHTVGPLDSFHSQSTSLPSMPSSDPATSQATPPFTAAGPTSTTAKRAGSLTPGGTISKSELSTMAGTIASKLDQYLEGTTNGSINGLHRQDRGSNDSNISTGSLSNLISGLGNQSESSLQSHGVNGASEVGGELDEDTALANNLAAISLAAQKISDIYLEPKPKKSAPDGTQVTSEHFEPEKHFYPRVLNAQIHPMVGYFFSLGNERIIARYMHLNPQVSEDVLRKCLAYVPKHFQWAVAHGGKQGRCCVCTCTTPLLPL